MGPRGRRVRVWLKRDADPDDSALKVELDAGADVSDLIQRSVPLFSFGADLKASDLCVVGAGGVLSNRELVAAVAGGDVLVLRQRQRPAQPTAYDAELRQKSGRRWASPPPPAVHAPSLTPPVTHTPPLTRAPPPPPPPPPTLAHASPMRRPGTGRLRARVAEGLLSPPPPAPPPALSVSPVRGGGAQAVLAAIWDTLPCTEDPSVCARVPSQPRAEPEAAAAAAADGPKPKPKRRRQPTRSQAPPRRPVVSRPARVVVSPKRRRRVSHLVAVCLAGAAGAAAAAAAAARGRSPSSEPRPCCSPPLPLPAQCLTDADWLLSPACGRIYLTQSAPRSAPSPPRSPPRLQ